jgi:AcrR family transcriptional regulator
VAKDKRNEILNAAGKCFAKFGYDKTTLDDIGKMVGMNKASLYYYFDNKEAIFKEMITREAHAYRDLLKEKVEQVRGCRQKILAWIEEGFKFNQSGSILHQLSMEMLQKLSPILEELKNDAFENGALFLASILDNGQKQNEMIPCDSLKIARAIQNVIYSIKDSVMMKARPNLYTEIDFPAMIREILFTVSLILDGISIK